MEKNFDFKVIEVRRVAKVTEGGKRLKVRAVVIVGDRNGQVGLGIGKGQDIADAVIKARKAAEKKLIKVPIVNGTIPYEVKVKFGAAKILLKPAKQGRGLIAGDLVKSILSLAGYSNVVSKILSVSKNYLLNALVTFKALEKLQNYEKRLKLKEKLRSKNADSSNKV